MIGDELLPIEPALPRLRAELATGRNVVLHAPPGAGKTTRAPLVLLDELWLQGKSIVMLEPRRLATRAAARRLAQMRGEEVGGVVGYRMRMEQRVSARTRLEVVTEGVLTRRLQTDPTLDAVGLVIFDEFHERSLNADVALALTLRTQQLVRDDLRILVMSATLDGAAVARLLGDAPIVSTEGRAYPVETRYLAPRPGQRLEAATAAAIAVALEQDTGDALVFLPGTAEIRRVESLLAERSLGPNVIVAPLHGSLPQEAQDRAIAPAPPGRRKVVLSTSIAETSLTIEGVRVVIDAGLSRLPRFSPRSGMTRLETVRVSRASADQRRGRAGRLGPGVCYRLWSEHEELHLPPFTAPEIVNADLAPLALDLAAAGVTDPNELAWLDRPSEAAFAQARELLVELEALDQSGAITAHGRRMAELPTHPRLAHMMLRGAARGRGQLACEIAALVEDRDLLRGEGGLPDADLALRVDALRGTRESIGGASVDRDATRRARDEAARLLRALGASRDSHGTLDDIGALLALAYPDRVGQRRAGAPRRYLLRNGRGAAFESTPSFGDPAYIVAAELDDRRPESRVFLAAAVELDAIREEFADQIVIERIVEWRDDEERVVTHDRERLGAIVLRETTSPHAAPEQVLHALLEELRRRGVGTLPWTDASRRIRQRIAFAASLDTAWPDVSDEALGAALDRWLGPRLEGAARLSDVKRVDFADALLALLDWKQRRALDEIAPTHLTVPSGSNIPIDYENPAAPTLAVRLQEMFGLTDTPRVGGGRVPLTIQLLSPAHRPVQVTQDLAGFWRTSYFDVRRDLRGRYPKHEWPENPLEAQPTRRAKPRR